MASINFKKIKSKSTVAALMRHNDSGERLKHEHANEHIDKSRTKDNYQMYGYRESAARFNDRIKELDSTTNTNKRRDRVEAVAIEIPMPAEGMTREDELKVAATYADFLYKTYGSKNVCGFWYHRDEIHTYTDSLDGKEHTSRGHIHAIVVPEVDGKLNCKLFTNKASMIEANKRLDKLVYERHGMHLMTGEKPKKQTVEALKAEERNRKLDKEIQERRTKLKEGQDKLDALNKDIRAQGDKIRQLSRKYDANTEILEALSDDLERAAELIDEGRAYLDLIDKAERGELEGVLYVDEGRELQSMQLEYVDETYNSPRDDIEDYLR